MSLNGENRIVSPGNSNRDPVIVDITYTEYSKVTRTSLVSVLIACIHIGASSNFLCMDWDKEVLPLPQARLRWFQGIRNS